MSRYSIGLVIDESLARAVAVHVRNGAVAGASVAESPREACARAISAAKIASEQLIGIGMAQAREPLAQLPDFSLPVPVVQALATHACVAGSGVASPSTVVIVSGSPTVYLMNSRIEADVPGVARGVPDLILPGYFGYEISGPDEALSDELPAARQLEIAFDLRRKCEALRGAGVHVRRFVAAGTLARDAPAMMQLLADVLDARIKPGASDDPAPLGAAILAAISAGSAATGHASISQTIHAMAPRRMHPIYRPDLRARKEYDRLYEESVRS